MGFLSKTSRSKRKSLNKEIHNSENRRVNPPNPSFKKKFKIKHKIHLNKNSKKKFLQL